MDLWADETPPDLDLSITMSLHSQEGVMLAKMWLTISLEVSAHVPQQVRINKAEISWVSGCVLARMTGTSLVSLGTRVA